jgi:hypothetical protein
VRFGFEDALLVRIFVPAASRGRSQRTRVIIPRSDLKTMRIGRSIALLGTFAGGLACAPVHFWTFTAGWDLDRAHTALAVLSLALFPLFIPAVARSKRLKLGPMSTSGPHASALMALAPHVFLYALLSAAAYMLIIGAGGIESRNGRYYQNSPNWGRRIMGNTHQDKEWEITGKEYMRIRGFEMRFWSSWVFAFYFCSFAVLALPGTSQEEGREATPAFHRK